MCMVLGLAWGLPSNSHLLKVARSIRDRLLFHDRPRDSLFESLDRGRFDWKEMGLDMSNPLW